MYEVIARINNYLINPLIIFLFALAGIFFIWGVYSSYIADGSPEGRQDGSRHILSGLIGMVIMIGVFAIMHFILNTLGVNAPKTLP